MIPIIITYLTMLAVWSNIENNHIRPLIQKLGHKPDLIVGDFYADDEI